MISRYGFVPHGLQSDENHDICAPTLIDENHCSSWGAMTWIKRLYSPGEVDRAGKILVHGTANSVEEIKQSLQVFSNWRAAHGYPLEVALRALRSQASRIAPNVIVAERLKRFPSILSKLTREPHMKLSQMQDIGGCRAILNSIDDVDRLLAPSRDVEAGMFSDLKKYDYISTPKKTGYRGVHFVWRYRSAGSDQDYNGMRIEIQVRSALQHAWATAVEMAATYQGEDLKSGLGNPRWSRFFALMGSAVALHEECPIVPGTQENKRDLIRELRTLTEELKVPALMESWSTVMEIRSVHANIDARLFLITLRPADRQWFVDVRPFSADESRTAEKA